MYKRFFKRVIDFFAALCALPFVLFVIVIFGPIIFITDRGPIFFRGYRVGKDGRLFRMYKLRSMYVGAKDIRNADGSTYNSSNDSRVTPIGRFLRKTSIDEIPQFLNVLFGDMSLIGPRPTVDLNLDLSTADEMTRKRYSVKPGITGYAQAYYRNSISSEEKLKWNCYYADNVSFMLDVKIIFKTIQSVILRKNINAK